MPAHVLEPATAAVPPYPSQTAVSVCIPAGEQLLHGELTVPATAVGVIICAGDRADCVARSILETGNATLRLDLLTAAERREDRVTHGFHFDVPLLAQRLVAATRWLAHQASTANLGFGYFGEEIMGAAALVAAAELGIVVDAVACRETRADFAANALPRIEAATLLICRKGDSSSIQINRHALERLNCEKQLQLIPPPCTSGAVAPPDCVGCSLAAAWFRSYVRAR